jgi:hypothetical protein
MKIEDGALLVANTGSLFDRLGLRQMAGKFRRESYRIHRDIRCCF